MQDFLDAVRKAELVLERAAAALSAANRDGPRLTLQQTLLLMRIDGRPTMGQIEGAGTNLTYNVNKLVDLGLLQAVAEPTDRRVRVICRTKAGSALVCRIAYNLANGAAP